MLAAAEHRARTCRDHRGRGGRGLVRRRRHARLRGAQVRVLHEDLAGLPQDRATGEQKSILETHCQEVENTSAVRNAWDMGHFSETTPKMETNSHKNGPPHGPIPCALCNVN